MKRFFFTMAIVLTAVNSLFAALPADSVLRRQAARMLMVGFKGQVVDENSPVYGYITDLKVGSVIIFDIDVARGGGPGSHNVASKEQLTALTTQLREWADYHLLIAADQEGGRVARLKPEYGYSPTVSAHYLGEVNNEDTTRFYARRLASEMAQSGVNLNLAPVVDLINTENPPAGHIDRSFGRNATTIARNAGWFIDESRKVGVGCALKHFPGSGSASSDTHFGFVDVTSSWSPQELEPYKKLIKQGKVKFIMSAHSLNGNFDTEYPATLSRKILTDLLRNELHFDGVVISDDMYMQAIIDRYSIERAVVMAINAGIDMLCVGNNFKEEGNYDPRRPYYLVDIIVQAVKQGRIPYSRILEANHRIDQASKKLK